MPSSKKKHRRNARRARQSAAEKAFAKLESTIDRELQKALLHLEGRIPTGDHISKYGERQLQQTDSDGADTVFIWKGHEILRFSQPFVVGGKIQIGIDRKYLEES